MKPFNQHLFIFSGEPSGDLHGSYLVEALKSLDPHLHVEGVAGPRMREKGIMGPLKMEDFAVMGFSDVIKSFPKLYSHFYTILNSILKTMPKAVVLIDYPGFNLRLAKKLRKNGFKGKIIHYISPSIWAWGKHRIQQMEQTLDLLLTIYPFEKQYFSNTSLNVQYVGSPIQQYLDEYTYDNEWKTKLKIPKESDLIALFPGSRKNEIDRNLPIILESADLLKKDYPQYTFAISCFNEYTQNALSTHLHKYPSLKDSCITIPKQYTYELMKESKSAIAKSGTVTLELALHQCPTVAIYKLSLINRLYAQYFLKLELPHYCIVNIIAEKEIFPELIENGLSAPKLFEEIKALNENTIKRTTCINACNELKQSLGCLPTNVHAAKEIIKAII